MQIFNNEFKTRKKGSDAQLQVKKQVYEGFPWYQ